MSANLIALAPIAASKPARELAACMDLTVDRLMGEPGSHAVAEFAEVLSACRNAIAADVWETELIPLCRQHPLHALLLEDPYTLRAFQKPRGYPGDAVMLDYLYSGVAPVGTSRIGRDVFADTTRTRSGLSVLDRRDRLACRIDETARKFTRPRLLSIACGHLREAQQAEAVRTQRIGTFFALDQDAQSLQLVATEQSAYGVQTVHSSIKAILQGRLPFPALHFVYAAGLLDYLSDPVAARLVYEMFNLLGPGGTLLVANFLPGNHGRAYMEAIMDWRLTLRTVEQVRGLDTLVRAAMVHSKRTYVDAHDNVVYLEIVKSP